MVSLSLGFEIEDDADEGADALGGIAVTCLAPDGGEAKVAVEMDTTGGLRRSGVMILKFPAATGAGAEQVLLFRSAEGALVPRLLRISTNALPVVQRATFDPQQAPTSQAAAVFCPSPAPGGRARGSASSRCACSSRTRPRKARSGAWSQGKSGLELDVRVQDGQLRRWTRAGLRDGSLRDAGPDDECYELTEQPDGSRIDIDFGNGINGRRPPLGARSWSG